MDYALLTEEDLNLSGNILGEIYVTGDARATLNANMHTNSYLRISGNSASVIGFGTYTMGGSASPSKALQGTFDPNYNPGGEASAQQAPYVDIPDFDLATYLNSITVDETSSNVTLSGNNDLGGTREDPYIWHITGDLSALGGAQVSGYVMFLVEGNVEITGNLIAGASGYNGPDESNIAIYTGGNMILGGNVDIYGQIYAEGDILFQGTPSIYGSITNKGSVTLSGTPNIYYRSASPALTTIWQDAGPISIHLVAYSEW
jgi:hypothetical protein